MFPGNLIDISWNHPEHRRVLPFHLVGRGPQGGLENSARATKHMDTTIDQLTPPQLGRHTRLAVVFDTIIRDITERDGLDTIWSGLCDSGR